MEVDGRLRLLPLCLDRITQSHLLMMKQKPAVDPKDALSHFNLMSGPLRLDTESLYWQCGRLRKLIRELPGLKSFEAVGVRDVRNHLIEHPEGKASRILMSSFGWSANEGPRIKTARPVGSNQDFMDAGAFANLTEFAQNLSTQILVALPR